MAKRIRMPKKDLSPEQERIVNWTTGSLLVNAGAGSGKTACVTERIARLIRNNINPRSIFATTFTKKAAEEMNQRLQTKGIDTNRMSVQTMHSFCFKIIKPYPEFKGWSVDDKDIAHFVIKNIIGYKRMKWQGCDVTKIEQFISSCRNGLVEPENCDRMLKGEFTDFRYKRVYFEYHEDMRTRKLLTFDDMLYYGVRTLDHDPHVLDQVQAQYQYVIIDEFQDSNYAQIRLGELVAAPEFNYMVVGDTDQSLYSWRGALPEFMLEFSNKYGAEVISLGINYRCAPAIVTAAAKCIEHNEIRIPKDLNSFRTNIDTVPIVQVNTDSDDEAAFVRERVQQHFADGINYGNMSVLMRTNAQSRAIEEEFLRHDIPFVVLGAVSFYERKEIAGLLSYLRVLIHPEDTKSGEISLTRPFRYIGRAVLDKIAGEVTNNYFEAVANVADKNRGVPYSFTLSAYVRMMKSFDRNSNPSDILIKIIEETRYIDALKSEEGGDTAESSRALNVGELIASASRFYKDEASGKKDYNPTEEFIKYIDKQIKLRRRNQIKANDRDESRVQVMSVHKSKGLQFTVIFVIGCNEGILPHAYGEEEEERRIFYVAMTRAEDHLYLSTINGATIGTTTVGVQQSRFIEEAGLVSSNNTLTEPPVDATVKDTPSDRSNNNENPA